MLILRTSTIPLVSGAELTACEGWYGVVMVAKALYELGIYLATECVCFNYIQAVSRTTEENDRKSELE